MQTESKDHNPFGEPAPEGQRDYSQIDDKTLHWFVMLHRNPKLLDLQLQRENVRRSWSHDGQPLLEYFIPFRFLTHLPEKEGRGDARDVAHTNNLRNDFHDFVFIHTTRRQITQFLDSEWNHAMRHRLRHYRDIHYREVIISDEEKDHLIRIFSERRIRFSIGLPVPNLGPDVQVQICKEGAFCGQTARILEVKHTTDGICLKLGISMFNGMKELKLSNIKLQDIQIEGEPDDIIGPLFVQNTEETLLDILERRVKHTGTDETLSQDATMLNHIFLYSYVTINDVSLSAHFLSLMLICATLRFDRDSVSALTPHVRALLTSGIKFTPAIIATLNFALFIATRDADYRTAGRQCVQQHPNHSTPSLRRLMSLISPLRGKRKHSRKH